MTTAIANDQTAPRIGGQHHFLLRRVHSLTGIVFGAYLVGHLLINATLAEGFGANDIFQHQVGVIHTLPFLAVVEWALIYLPIIFHGSYGIWIAWAARWNIRQYRHARNYLYVLQRISGLILIAFIAFHVLAMKGWFGHRLAFDPAHATLTLAQHLNASWLIAYVIYPIGILASCYHTANGFWTAAITWGLITHAAGQRRWGYLCAGLGGVMLLLGFLALFGGIRDGLHLSEIPAVSLAR